MCVYYIIRRCLTWSACLVVLIVPNTFLIKITDKQLCMWSRKAVVSRLIFWKTAHHIKKLKVIIIVDYYHIVHSKYQEYSTAQSYIIIIIIIILSLWILWLTELLLLDILIDIKLIWLLFGSKNQLNQIMGWFSCLFVEFDVTLTHFISLLL